MKLKLPLLLITYTHCLCNFWQNVFSSEKSHTNVILQQKIIGSTEQQKLKNEAQLFKIYNERKKYLGNLILHQQYISHEHEGNLNDKEVKRFYQIAQTIYGKEGYTLPRIKKDTSKKKKNNSLHDGETLANLMDYWTQH